MDTPDRIQAPEGAHPSFTLDNPSREEVERVWRSYWLPMVREGGLDRLKGELYDYFRLVDNARKVYRHVTGGMTDDLCASAEGIIRAADSRVDGLTEALRGQVARLQGQVEELRRESRGR